MALEDDAPQGGEQTPTPVTPVPASAPAEHVPGETARQSVRRAFEQTKSKVSEQDEARAPRAVRSEENADEGGEDPGKPAIDRTRDPQGRFVRGEGQEQPPGEKSAQEAPEAPQIKEEPAGVVALRPPPGWSAAARAQYASLPPEVREAVAKREGEVATGFQALQKYKGLETYTPVIEASGITHAEFTKRAVEWEQSLKTNPIGTLLHVARLGNIDIVRLAQQIMQQGGQQAVQQQAQVPRPATVQQAVQQAYQQPDIDARIQQVLAEREAHSSVDEFLADPKNIHAEAVADLMASLIQGKYADDLQQAYDMACNATPEIRALLIRQASATPGSVSETERARRKASEAKAAAKATVGAPSGPRPEQKEALPKTTHDAVHRAYREVKERAGL